MSVPESQVFFCQRMSILLVLFCAKSQISAIIHFFVDKIKVLWLNSSIPLYIKALTENLPFSNAAESRCLVRTGADGLGDLIPELILWKRNVSNEIRLPPLWSGPCWRLRGISLRRGNQGGTANLLIRPWGRMTSGTFLCILFFIIRSGWGMNNINSIKNLVSSLL